MVSTEGAGGSDVSLRSIRYRTAEQIELDDEEERRYGK